MFTTLLSYFASFHRRLTIRLFVMNCTSPSNHRINKVTLVKCSQSCQVQTSSQPYLPTCVLFLFRLGAFLSRFYRLGSQVERAFADADASPPTEPPANVPRPSAAPPARGVETLPATGLAATAAAASTPAVRGGYDAAIRMDEECSFELLTPPSSPRRRSRSRSPSGGQSPERAAAAAGGGSGGSGEHEAGLGASWAGKGGHGSEDDGVGRVDGGVVGKHASVDSLSAKGGINAGEGVGDGPDEDEDAKAVLPDLRKITNSPRGEEEGMLVPGSTAVERRSPAGLAFDAKMAAAGEGAGAGAAAATPRSFFRRVVPSAGSSSGFRGFFKAGVRTAVERETQFLGGQM